MTPPACCRVRSGCRTIELDRPRSVNIEMNVMNGKVNTTRPYSLGETKPARIIFIRNWTAERNRLRPPIEAMFFSSIGLSTPGKQNDGSKTDLHRGQLITGGQRKASSRLL